MHSDLNGFYASVECFVNPEIRQKPVAVAGNVENRHGIILAKNELAKKYKISTGEPIWMAKQKCPDIVIVPPNYDLYLKFSGLAREIYMDYSGLVESFGLDECWLDISPLVKSVNEGGRIADEIRARIKAELGITASVGVSYNKIFAKLGSDYKKPDATTIITRDNYRKVVWQLPVSDLLYVGRATTAKLNKYGICTIGELAGHDVSWLRRRLGKNGETLWVFANGLDASPVRSVDEKALIKSVGNSTTTPRDLISDTDIKITLYILSESVAARLREYGFQCSTVQVSIRDSTLASYERQVKLDIQTNASKYIFEAAYALVMRNMPANPIRSLGVRACKLNKQTYQQMSFLPEIINMHRQEARDKAVDRIRDRFGYFVIRRGIMLLDKELANLDPKSDHTIHPVSYFR